MIRLPAFVLIALCSLQTMQAKAKPPEVGDGPRFTPDGQMMYPAEYREWIFLTSGLDMSYNPKDAASAHPVFDNVFVNPSAYKVFMKTGTWPEGSTFVLENRASESSQSINVRGQTQSTIVKGTEVHVKDSAHIKGGWGFYGFKDKGSAKLMERPIAWYSCHEQHAAVDTTFVQFYPTLIGIAKAKGVLSPKFLKEMPPPTTMPTAVPAGK